MCNYNIGSLVACEISGEQCTISLKIFYVKPRVGFDRGRGRV